MTLLIDRPAATGTQPDVPPTWPPVPPEPPTVPPSHHSPARRRMLAAAVAAILAVGGGVAGGLVGTHFAGDSSRGTVAATTVANGQTLSTAQIAALVSPSVVTITVSAGGQTAEGSGVILTQDGRLLTNNHVISGGGGIRVTFSDGRTVAATVVGADASHDLAVLQAQGVSGLTPATLGSSSNLRVGDPVLAFGSPLGLEGTVTAGIVSAVDRDVSASSGSSGLSGLIQTDAAINPGNSGGPLVNTAGQVIGIDVAIATTGQDSGNIGVGFAIPIDTVRSVISPWLS